MEQIWWNHIIKAHSFLESIVTETVKGAVCCSPCQIPFRGEIHL